MLDVEHSQDVGRIGGELRQVADRAVEVLAVTADRNRQLLLPDLERAAGDRVQCVEDLVQLHGGLDAATREQPAVG